MFSIGKTSGKQIQAIQNQGNIKKIKNYAYNDKDIPLFWKQKELIEQNADEELEETTKKEITKKVVQ